LADDEAERGLPCPLAASRDPLPSPFVDQRYFSKCVNGGGTGDVFCGIGAYEHHP
jgi:hypothetical protein